MGGLVLTFGKGSRQAYTGLRATFEELTGLKMAREHLADGWQCAAFSSTEGGLHSWVHEDDDVFLAILGTPFFEGVAGETVPGRIARRLALSGADQKLADDLDGHFCLAALHKRRQKAWVVTDYAGVINTFKSSDGRVFALASSLLAMARHFPSAPDPESLAHFLSIGHCVSDRTFFKGISLTEPASIREMDLPTGTAQVRTYWSYPRKTDPGGGFEQSVDRVHASLERIVTQLPVRETVYDFTGGYDCRLVVAVLLGAVKRPSDVSVFFFGPPDSREAKIIRDNARNLGLNLFNDDLPHDWPEQFADYSLECHRIYDGQLDAFERAPTIHALKEKRRHFRYSANGLSGELYRQRLWEWEMGARGRRRPANTRRMMHLALQEPFDGTPFSGGFHPVMDGVEDGLVRIFHRDYEELEAGNPNTVHYDKVFFNHRFRRFHGQTVTGAGRILAPVSPLWFREPLEVGLSVPYTFKLRGRMVRTIALRSSRELASQRMINNTPMLPITPRYLPRFLPGASFLALKFVRKSLQVAFRKFVLSGLTQPDYDKASWYGRALSDRRFTDLIDHASMVTAPLYDGVLLRRFFDGVREGRSRCFAEAGRIITLELSMRKAGVDRSSVEDAIRHAPPREGSR